MGKYRVRAGDTLSKIALNTGSTVKLIMANNPFITNKNMIRVGWELEIPNFNEDKPEPVTPPAIPDTGEVGAAFRKCVDAVRALPEYLALEMMVYGDKD